MEERDRLIREEGEKKGIEKGIEKGMQKGIQKGEKIGEIKVLISFMRKAIQKNEDIGSIVKAFDLDEDEELAVYRIIQESITNAIKHSHADTIDLKIQKSENAIRISIHDNGIGCPDIHFGFGLSHMQSRIEMLHGELKVWTENGFSIEAVIPLRKNLEAEQ